MNVNLYAESAIQNYPAATMNSTHCKQKNNGTRQCGDFIQRELCCGF